LYTKDNWFLAPRAKLTLFSYERPDLVDAKFTQIAQCDPDVPGILSEHHLLGGWVNVEDHLKYRYLVDVDGNSCTYSRCYWILLSNSLLLKQVSDNTQWYYKGLIPYQHYVPLADDLSDIFEKVEWSKEHDQEAQEIARNATEFASENLSLENTYLYFYRALQEYAKLQQFSPK
jgi:hypothetical protein